MKTIQNIAAGLLALTGLVHVAQLIYGFDAAIIITALFGLAYLAIAWFIYKSRRTAYWLGVFLPLLGLVLSLPGMLSAPNLLVGFFIVVDAIVIGLCLYLIFKSWPSTKNASPETD